MFKTVIIILIFTSINISSYTISGKILNQITKDPVSNISLNYNGNLSGGTIETDNYGNFSFDYSNTPISALSNNKNFKSLSFYQGKLNLNLTQSITNLSIQIYTLSGKNIITQKFKNLHSGNNIISLLKNPISSGVFLIKLTTDEFSSTIKYNALHKYSSKNTNTLNKNSSTRRTFRSQNDTITLTIDNSNFLEKIKKIAFTNNDSVLDNLYLKPSDYVWKVGKVFQWNSFNGNPSSLIGKAESNDINMIQLMDRYFTEGNSNNKNIISFAHAKDIKVFPIFQTFFNDNETVTASNSALDKNGNQVSEEWLTFICPNEEIYKSKRLNEIKSLVKDIQPDGISLDFFRYFVYWESNSSNSLTQSCFCSRCLNKFSDQYGISASPNEIINNYLDEWTEFKCNTIIDYAKKIHDVITEIKPDIMMNLHMVPWRQNDFDGSIKTFAAQDICALSDIFDSFQPMTYSSLMGQNINWIYNVTSDAAATVNSSYIIPCIQSTDANSENFNTISQSPSSGYAIWPFEQL